MLGVLAGQENVAQLVNCTAARAIFKRHGNPWCDGVI
jgi:hypothetical protein